MYYVRHRGAIASNGKFLAIIVPCPYIMCIVSLFCRYDGTPFPETGTDFVFDRHRFVSFLGQR